MTSGFFLRLSILKESIEIAGRSSGDHNRVVDLKKTLKMYTFLESSSYGKRKATRAKSSDVQIANLGYTVQESVLKVNLRLGKQNSEKQTISETIVDCQRGN